MLAFFKFSSLINVDKKIKLILTESLKPHLSISLHLVKSFLILILYYCMVSPLPRDECRPHFRALCTLWSLSSLQLNNETLHSLPLLFFVNTMTKLTVLPNPTFPIFLHPQPHHIRRLPFPSTPTSSVRFGIGRRSFPVRFSNFRSLFYFI